MFHVNSNSPSLWEKLNKICFYVLMGKKITCKNNQTFPSARNSTEKFGHLNTFTQPMREHADKLEDFQFFKFQGENLRDFSEGPRPEVQSGTEK